MFRSLVCFSISILGLFLGVFYVFFLIDCLDALARSWSLWSIESFKLLAPLDGLLDFSTREFGNSLTIKIGINYLFYDQLGSVCAGLV